MSKNVIRLFESAQHAADYAKFRPTPPRALIDRILDYLARGRNRVAQGGSPRFEHAVDVGCGSGQSTRILAPYFERVTGIDVSAAQIDEARKRNDRPNVSFRIGTLGEVDPASVRADLVTVSQAFHWFDRVAFFEQSRRLLKDDGALAIYSYLFPRLSMGDASERLNGLVDHLYKVDTAQYWHGNRKTVDDELADVDLPCDDVVREKYEYTTEATLQEFTGYVKTWSGVQLLMEKTPEKARGILEKLERDLMDAIGTVGSNGSVAITLVWRYTLLLGRKKAHAS